jgi:hypothetical protein
MVMLSLLRPKNAEDSCSVDARGDLSLSSNTSQGLRCVLVPWSRSAFSLDSNRWPAAVGRRRVYVNSISLPQTCRSNWHAIQPTTKRVMAGQFLSFALKVDEH